MPPPPPSVPCDSMESREKVSDAADLTRPRLQPLRPAVLFSNVSLDENGTVRVTPCAGSVLFVERDENRNLEIDGGRWDRICSTLSAASVSLSV